jgi:hypothetical protein
MDRLPNIATTFKKGVKTMPNRGRNNQGGFLAGLANTAKRSAENAVHRNVSQTAQRTVNNAMRGGTDAVGDALGGAVDSVKGLFGKGDGSK